MDDLIDDLMEAFLGYADAKKELKECADNCEYDAGYFCQRHSQTADEYRDDIKIKLKEIIKAAQ